MRGRSAAQSLVSLVAGERSRFENRDNNIFAFAFSQALRYCGFTSEIVNRYRASGKSYILAAKRYFKRLGDESRRFTKADVERWDELDRQSALVQLEMESYYLFSKILLDRLAQAVELYFGRAHGVSIHTHHRLADNLEIYAKDRKLRAWRAFWRSAKSLQDMISTFRDKFVAHENCPRTVKSLSFTTRGRVTKGDLPH